jgi:hypothetical protein
MRTMKTLVFSVLMLTSSIAIADHIRSDYDRSAAFYTYRTYMWIKEPQLANPPENQSIINAVNAELQLKGLCLVTENADLAVSVTTATCAQHELRTFYAPLAGGWSWYSYWTPAEPSITVVELFDGDSLVVDVSDTQTERIVWWGTATEIVTDNISRLNRGVEKMFTNFPPGA